MSGEDNSKDKVSVKDRAAHLQQKINTYEKPKKVTRDDILNRWDDSYDRRVELAKKAKQPSIISRAVIGVSLASALLLGLSTANGASSYKDNQAQNVQQISTLKSQLADAKNQVNEVPTQVDAAKLIVDANKLGIRFAQLQNDMVTVQSNLKTYDLSKIQKSSNEMANSMEDSVKSSATPWYSITRQKENPYHDMKFTWQAQTPYAFENDGQNIKIVWLCKDDKGTLLAWAIGKYDAGSKKLSGLIRGMTTAGSNRVGTPVDDADPNPDKSSSPSPSGKASPQPSTSAKSGGK